jgi:hypothetical protein
VAGPDAWFTYYFWDDDSLAPDYARTIDIHRKPGYDPCELFLDPALKLPKFAKSQNSCWRKNSACAACWKSSRWTPRWSSGSHGRDRVPANERPGFC